MSIRNQGLLPESKDFSKTARLFPINTERLRIQLKYIAPPDIIEIQPKIRLSDLYPFPI